MEKLFGTDGIRGNASKFPLDDTSVFVIGRSLAQKLSDGLGRKGRILIGRDTRQSGGRIEKAFYNGAVSGGAECVSAGIITTPGVAFLTNSEGFDAGVVISASHNPFEDNGIKVFNPSGKKISEITEREIEKEIYAARDAGEVFAIAASVASDNVDLLHKKYLDHLSSMFPALDLKGMKIAVDCANGAASEFAPQLFRSLGAEVFAIFDAPDGENINRDCGSLHLGKLQDHVKKIGADFGVAFDGDADRSLFVNDKGAIVDGDAVLFVMGKYLLGKGLLDGNTVVATVMSNIGLELALKSNGISLTRTPVGDKYVLAELLESGTVIGGEQSGHIIFPKESLVGDGMMSALQLLHVIAETGSSLSELTQEFVAYPQILINVRVGRKIPFEQNEVITTHSSEVEQKLSGNGRLLLRYSGTENLARVMIEGKDQAEIERLARGLADVIAVELQ